jgi:delta24(24(1))-sterol reductase
MLIFWNLAGVPLSYCHCALYLANHLDTVSEWNYPAARPTLLVLLLTTYLFVYAIWDLAGSQKRQYTSNPADQLLLALQFQRDFKSVQANV